MHHPQRNWSSALGVVAGLGLALASFGACESAPETLQPAPAPAPPTVPPAATPAVPSGSGFLTSDICARCHSKSPLTHALTTAAGDDASPHGLWQATPMANSFRDPYWRAQMAHEIERAPESRAQVEEMCLRCHAPMASHAADMENRALPSMESLRADPLALDGVSCVLCHRIQPDGLGSAESFNGRPVIKNQRRIFGPFENPTTGPMRANTGFTPTAAKHVSSSALCGTCHTLTNMTGESAHGFVEQAPYLEWRNSVYSDESGASAESRTCQACHMADMGRMKIARSPTGEEFFIETRDNVRGHVLVGGNAWLIDLLRLNKRALGVTASDESLVRAAAATRAQLAFNTAKLEIENVVRKPDRLSFDLAVWNLTGHKLPTGYPARRAWLQVEVLRGDQVLFKSGAFDERGHLIGIADELDIPHVERVEQATDVPVYEMVALDAHDRVTTSVVDMAAHKKDTRLLPRGWRADGPHAGETAPVGIGSDPDFVGGGDRVSYDIKLAQPNTGRLTVIAWFFYQPIPPAWVEPLRSSLTQEAATFVRMYDAARFMPEALALVIRNVN